MNYILNVIIGCRSGLWAICDKEIRIPNNFCNLGTSSPITYNMTAMSGSPCKHIRGPITKITRQRLLNCRVRLDILVLFC